MKFFFLTGALASAAPFCEEDSEVQIEPLVFSSTPNPVVTLTAEQKQAFCAAAATAAPRTRSCRVLGFTGWRACTGSDACEVFRGDRDIDAVLLEAVRGELSQPVLAHIKEETTRLLSSNDLCEEDSAEPSNEAASCDTMVVGPDDPSQVHYDVANDDDGCFVTKQRYNNCYNYGNDIVTNGFAQPGRRDFDGGDGLCSHSARPCVPNTCEDVKNGAIADGLTWVGTELPTELPAEGHYISLHIWPDSNFHWLRMDADMKFSHKPGGSPVKNVDNDGNLITDPSQQDFSPWSQHCGYMHTVPSKVAAGPDAQVQV